MSRAPSQGVLHATIYASSNKSPNGITIAYRTPSMIRAFFYARFFLLVFFFTCVFYDTCVFYTFVFILVFYMILALQAQIIHITTPFGILGVQLRAPINEITIAYRTLFRIRALQAHNIFCVL